MISALLRNSLLTMLKVLLCKVPSWQRQVGPELPVQLDSWTSRQEIADPCVWYFRRLIFTPGRASLSLSTCFLQTGRGQAVRLSEIT
jgi:hypothetical protein